MSTGQNRVPEMIALVIAFFSVLIAGLSLFQQHNELKALTEQVKQDAEAQEELKKQFKEAGAQYELTTEVQFYKDTLLGSVLEAGSEFHRERPIATVDLYSCEEWFSNMDPPAPRSVQDCRIESMDNTYSTVYSSNPKELREEGSSIGIIATVTNSGRSAGAVSGMDWRVSREINEPFIYDGRPFDDPDAKCINSNNDVVECKFPVTLGEGESTRFLVNINNSEPIQQFCDSDIILNFQLGIKSVNDEVFAEDLATAFEPDNECPSE